MNITPIDYFVLFVATFSLVALLTPLMRKIAISKNILDRPNSSHKTHSISIPYLGGVAIILGVVIITYSAILFSEFTKNKFWLATSILGPAIVLGLIGLWDDIKQLRPLPRLISQTIAGVVIAMILILGNNVGNPTGSIVLDIFITIFWVVGICNSINFFDNLDGGAAGTSAISSIALSVIAIHGGQILIAALSVVLAGATLGFLIWNKSPAKIYMGDAGALFIGVLLATLTVRLNPTVNSILASLTIPVLLLAIPILDTSVAVISRILRKISPFQGGKDHLSHRLIKIGFSRKISVFILWSLSVFFSLIAITLVFLPSIYGIIQIFCMFIIWLILFIIFIKMPSA
jgi:UDP-GlcNAc:undecaprenyl-phosphate GlcNAc-1-phosphate transferase